MTLKIPICEKPKKECKLEQGFSLLETAIALVTLAICLAYAMPLFLYAKINNSKSEIRTGALIVAQRVFDDIRSQSISGLPNNDGKSNPNLVGCSDPQTGDSPSLKYCTNASYPTVPNPVIMPAILSTPTSGEKLLTKAMGRQYQTKITYCPDLNSDPTICSTRYRKFKVEVHYNGSKVYDLEATFTDFE